jgi:hypothetical protein
MASIERARAALVEDGELPAQHREAYRSPLGPEEREFVLRVLRDGTYDAAVAQIGLEDPELADQ